MGSFSITVGTTASPRTVSKTVSDSDITNRLVPAMRWFFRDVAGGSSSLTANQLLDLYFALVQRELQRIVHDFEQDAARSTADTGIIDMPMT